MKIFVLVATLVLVFAGPVFAVDYRAALITPWTGDGTPIVNPNRPLAADVFALKKWSDKTGQPFVNLPPDPNIYIIHIVCDEAVLDSIGDDNRFLIIWSSLQPVDDDDQVEVPDNSLPMSVPERARLTGRLRQLGVPPLIANPAAQASGRDFSKQIANWMKSH